MTASENGNQRHPASDRRLWTWPNLVTFSRVLLVPFFLVTVLKYRADNWRLIQAGVFGVIALSDVLDGLLARRLHARSVIGAVIDPMADKIVIVPTYLVLSSQAVLAPDKTIPMWTAFPVIARDVLIALGSLAIYLHHKGMYISPTPLGKMTTLFQMATVMAFILAQVPGVFRQSFLVFLAAGTTVFTVASGVEYVILGTKQLAGRPEPAGS